MLRNTELKLITGYEDAQIAIEEISSLPIIAVDIFFSSESEKNAPLILLTGNEKIHYIFDFRRFTPEVLIDFFRLKNLKVLSSAIDKLLNLYRYRYMRVENITDILLLEQIISNNYFFQSEVSDLDDLAERYLGFRPEKGKRILIDNLSGEINEQMLEYLRIELLVIYKIFLEQVKRIKAGSLERVARIESNLIKSLAAIQYHGIYFDFKRFTELFSKAKEKSLLKEDNLLDEKEVKNLFYYGFKGDERLEKLLEEFASNYKDPAHILCLNANELIKRTEMPSSRIHSRFIQIASASGRSSSQSPNLFAIPKARIFREFFSAPEGKVLITLDYSTFELGVLAALSKDPHFLKAFRERLDLHSYVAELMFKKKVSKSENPELRRQAKAINFGLIYGMTAHGLAKRLGIEKTEAARLINIYFMIFPTLNFYIKDLINNALKSGELRTLAQRRCLIMPFDTLTEGRKKLLSMISSRIDPSASKIYTMLILRSLEEEYFKKGIPSEEMYIKRMQNVIDEGAPLKRAIAGIEVKMQELYRFIRNMPVQGTAADIMKLAISMIDDRLYEINSHAKIVNIVHDEILVEADRSEAVDVATLCKDIMREASRQILKEIEIDVDLKIGLFWGDDSLNSLLEKEVK